MADDREGRGRPLKPPPGKRGARLSPEERALWEHTASSLQPIKGKKGRVHAALEDADERADAAASKREIAKAAPKKPHAAPRPPHAPPKVTLPPPAPAPIALERRKARKLSSGRIEIDGRIDLHGMRQSEAHDALRRFLKRGYAEGKRWVLVITGKGAPARTALDERAEREGFERGVLRRNVPRWLAEPELAGIVIGFTTAAVNHGGEGALYVHLRKRGAPPGATADERALCWPPRPRHTSPLPEGEVDAHAQHKRRVRGWSVAGITPGRVTPHPEAHYHSLPTSPSGRGECCCCAPSYGQVVASLSRAVARPDRE